jgi:hypothetical protein
MDFDLFQAQMVERGVGLARSQLLRESLISSSRR